MSYIFRQLTPSPSGFVPSTREFNNRNAAWRGSLPRRRRSRRSTVGQPVRRPALRRRRQSTAEDLKRLQTLKTAFCQPACSCRASPGLRPIDPQPVTLLAHGSDLVPHPCMLLAQSFSPSYCPRGANLDLATLHGSGQKHAVGRPAFANYPTTSPAPPQLHTGCPCR